jgi:N-acetylglutamate synthase-like GNAT family acetyltransferase
MQARRATFEDLPQLIELWKLEKLDADGLEKRFTEFQVVEQDGKILGAIGLQIWTHHAVLHGECIGRAELAEQLRDLLWKRVQMVARNHNLDRIWTELPANFWRGAGFAAATPEQMNKFPDGFGDRTHRWQLMWLRGEEASADALEKQFAMLRAHQAQERDKLHSQVATLKKTAIIITAVVAVLVIAFFVVAIRYGPKFMHR